MEETARLLVFYMEGVENNVSKVGVGIIGCGNISRVYLKNCKSFESIEVLACADIDLERAKETARSFSVPKGCSVAELLADEDLPFQRHMPK